IRSLSIPSSDPKGVLPVRKKRTRSAARHTSSRREFLGRAIAAGTATSAFLATGIRSSGAQSATSSKSGSKSGPPDPAVLELSPGVRAGTGTIRNADDAAGRTVALAEEAGKQGTFAVGGLLVEDSGRVIAEATNAVIRNDRLSDPTAHVERQLVDWFANERRH